MNFSHLWHRYWHLLLFVFATAITIPFYHADVREYSEQVLAHANGQAGPFWEFGHLLLRPLVFVLWSTLGHAIGTIFGFSEFTQVSAVLVGLAWLCGSLAVHSMRSILEQLQISNSALWLTMVGFVFASAFLNFSQAGTSYIPGLAFILLGLSRLLQHSTSDKYLAGVFVAIGVGFWATYVWTIPALILAPSLLRDRQLSIRTFIRSSLQVGIPIALLFCLGALLHGVDSVEGIRTWIHDASHGDDRRGYSRMIFGLARSFLHMDDIGMLVRRYIADDPYNAVSLGDLLSAGLWKIAAYYVFLASLALSMIFAGKTKELAWVAVLMLPVLFFGASWDGAAVERYLPLFPAFFVLLGLATHSRTRSRFVGAAFVLMLVFVNGWSLLAPRMADARDARIEEVRMIVDNSPKAAVLVVLNLQDDVFELKRNFPFNSFTRQESFQPYVFLVKLDLQEAKRSFADRVKRAWDEGSDVWVRKALLADQPASWLYWAEEKSLKVKWKEIYEAFSRMRFAPTDRATFLMLERNSDNEAVIDEWAGVKSPVEGV